jgi:hypothetical protein
MPIEKYGKTYWPNCEMEGIGVALYHLSKDQHPKGGDNKFGMKMVLPQPMLDAVDWNRAKDDKEYRHTFGCDSLFMHVSALEKSLAMHPDCLEVTNFYGDKHDVSDMHIGSMVDDMLRGVAREQYDSEKERGIVPNGMTFDEWMEVAGPDTGSVSLSDWTPKGPSN